MIRELHKRIISKFKYHFSKDPLLKKIIEINRYSERIAVGKNEFCIKKYELWLPNEFLFIAERFDDVLHLLKIPGSGFTIVNNQLLYNIDQLRIYVNSAEDVYVLNEIFYEEIYQVLYPNEYSVIDIGMNVGIASLYFARLEPVKTIYAFEPFQRTYNLALQNFELNNQIAKKIRAHQFGLGLGSGIRSIPYDNQKKGKNRVIEASNNEVGSEQVEILDAGTEIQKIVSKFPNTDFFIKMDCEGSEFEIFESLNRNGNFPEQIKGIIMEWHEKYPDEIYKLLLDWGFRLHLNHSYRLIGTIVAFRN
jgi:FkbM family methyltransferase